MGEKFNENLKLARERKGISQKDIAENIGVAKSTYYCKFCKRCAVF